MISSTHSSHAVLSKRYVIHWIAIRALWVHDFLVEGAAYRITRDDEDCAMVEMIEPTEHPEPPAT